MTEKEIDIAVNLIASRAAIANGIFLVVALLLVIVFILLWLLDLKIKQVKPKSKISVA